MSIPYQGLCHQVGGAFVLTIYPQTSASDVKKYFQVADYYSQGLETVGRWGGKLAPELGLTGPVTKEAFDRMCDNLDPRTGEPLTPRTNDNRRVGYDFTVSGPKSYSILVALAPSEEERQRLRAAFDASLEETMDEAEGDMMTRVRKGGAFYDRKTGNLVSASFHHSTARPVDVEEFMARFGAGGEMPVWLQAVGGTIPPDMQEHTHVFVFNATKDDVEGRIKAGEFSGIKRDGEYFTALFYAKLAKRLEAMGYAIDRRGGKEWEIAGIPLSMIDTFTKRSEEIEAEHRRRMRDDPAYREAYKHELAAKTRSKKPKELTPEQLRAAWDAQLTDGERDALAAVYRREHPGSATVTPAQAAGFAIGHCFDKESLVPERKLVATALLHGLGHVTAEDVRGELERQGVLTGDLDGRVTATTQDIQREEAYIVTWAGQSLSTVPPVGVPEGLERGRLDDEQWNAVRGLLSTSDRVSMVDSAAGTGKSTLLAAYDRGMKLAGERVTYLGTTASSVKVLRGDGLEADTVARFLRDTAMQDAARGGRVVIDEASMLGHQDAYALFRLADALDVSLVFLGDLRQHGSVSRGALMRILQQYGGIQPFRLTQIKRQQDPDYRAAVKSLSEGNALDGFDALSRKGWVCQVEDATDRCRQMAADYVQALADNKSVLVVSPTHAEASRITAEIRAQLRDAGKLGAQESTFTRLVAVDATVAERGQATTYRPGDVIQFHQNARGFTKGQRLTVTDPAMVPCGEAARFSLYRPEAIALAEGDVIRFTGTVTTRDGAHKLRNGDVHSVAELLPGGNIRLDNGWVLGKDAGHFRHGFVETSMGSQGRTVQRVILGMSAASLPAINQEQMYVSASRAREQLRLYTDDVDGVRDAIRRSSAKKAALDLVPPLPLPQPARPDPLRAYRERRKRQEFASRWRESWDAPSVPQRQAAGATHAGRLTDHHDRGDDRGR
jgi:TrwC relaxase/AAA domain